MYRNPGIFVILVQKSWVVWGGQGCLSQFPDHRHGLFCKRGIKKQKRKRLSKIILLGRMVIIYQNTIGLNKSKCKQGR